MKIDPVCGMEVKTGSPHNTEYDGHEWHFCSAHCLEKFNAEPGQFTIDPVCGMHVKPESPHRVKHAGRSYRFCSVKCLHEFEDDPAAYEGKDQVCKHGHAAKPAVADDPEASYGRFGGVRHACQT